MATPLIYALGSNGSGQLGIGHTNDVSTTPQRCIFQPDSHVNSLPGKPEIGSVKKIVAGGNHTLILTETRRLFVAGRTGMREDSSDEHTVFREVTRHVTGFGSKDTDEVGITDIAASWEGSFIVFAGKKILCWGTGMKGALGLEDSLDDRSMNGAMRPRPSLKIVDQNRDVNIVAIQAGVAHVVVVLSDGDVQGWGVSRKGQLGEQFRHRKILWRPTRLDVGVDGKSLFPFAPERVVLGREHTVFLGTGKTPVVWGTGFHAHNNREKALRHDDVIVCGWSSIHILKTRGPGGEVRSMGKNNHGQLAPAGLPPIQTLAAGSEHCVAITTNSEVIAWGWGEHGNCGEEVDDKGNVLGRWVVIPLDLDDGIVVKDVAAGCATTFVVCGKAEG